MTAQSQVPKLYQSVIEDVINNVREAFMDEGVDESVLAELKNIWQSKLKASKVLESDVPPPTNDPMLAGPYIALQQQNNSTVSRHPGYVPQGHNIVDKQQQQQQDSRSPAANPVPVFTTLSHPGAELSDAASMAYSSIMQHAGPQRVGQQQGGVGNAGPQTAAGSRAQLVAAATAAQPQYIFATPGSGGPVLINQSQAMRLQQQQQQQTGRGAVRGNVPQVDGVLDNEEDELGGTVSDLSDPLSSSLRLDYACHGKEQRSTEDDAEENPDESPASDPNFEPSPQMRRCVIESVSADDDNSTRVMLPSTSRPFAFSSRSEQNDAATTEFDTNDNAGRDDRNHLQTLSSTTNSVHMLAATVDVAAVNHAALDAAAAAAATAATADPTTTTTTRFASNAAAELYLPSGQSFSGKIMDGKKRKTKPSTAATAIGANENRPTATTTMKKSMMPKKGDKIEIVFQVDGNNSSSDDDDDDDEDGDLNEDDSSDRDPDDEDIPGVEDEPLNSEDDVSDNDPEELFDTENVVVCQYEKISRVRNKWRFYLKDGIMNIQGRDYVFLKASGEAEW